MSEARRSLVGWHAALVTVALIGPDIDRRSGGPKKKEIVDTFLALLERGDVQNYPEPEQKAA